MSFLAIKRLSSVDTLQRKERISLVVGYSIQSCLIFFKDQSYVHYDRQSKSILKEGKLPFVASQVLQSQVKGRIIVFGLNEQKQLLIACMNVEKDYTIQTRQLSNTKLEPSARLHLLEPKSKQNRTFYIIRILKNIENGLAIEIYDFFRNIWQEQMLHLNSKFLQYIIVDTSQSDQNYKEIRDVYCHTFALIAQGERFDSVNYSKLKLCHQNAQNGLNLKLKFIITREVKIKQHFVVIGGMQTEANRLMLIGNSKTEDSNFNQTHHCSSYLIVNTHQIEIDQPQHIKIVKPFPKEEVERELMLRSLIGIVENNMLVTVSIGSKKLGVVKMSEPCCQLLLQFEMKKPPQLQLSSLFDSIFCYISKLQTFFEKLKAQPTILQFQLFRLQNKEKHYRKLLRQGFPKLDPNFTDLIIQLL